MSDSQDKPDTLLTEQQPQEQDAQTSAPRRSSRISSNPKAEVPAAPARRKASVSKKRTAAEASPDEGGDANGEAANSKKVDLLEHISSLCT